MKGKNSEIERGRSNRNELPKNLCIIIALEGSKTELNFQKRSLYKMSRWWTVKRAEAVWWKIPFSRGSIGAGGGWELGGRVRAPKSRKNIARIANAVQCHN